MNQSSMSAVPTIKCEEVASPAGAGADDPGGAAYNLSVNVNLGASVLGLLAAEASATTLRTPEIVNDLITMTNPLDQYSYNEKNSGFKSASGNDSNSSMSNGSSVTSPAAGTPAAGTPPSIQKTCSELIKAGLKLSIESKRKMSGSDTDVCAGAGVKRFKREDSDDDYDSSHTHTTKSEGLTPEDEERRRRRRERNKIAATKCRLKKRERTVNLVSESEVLENQNIDLKAQLKDLEVERRQLLEMLNVHKASCVKSGAGAGAGAAYAQAARYEPAPAPTPAPYTYEHGPYLRPESANILASATSFPAELEPIAAIEPLYMSHVLDPDYRPDSVLTLQPAEPFDPFVSKTAGLVPLNAEHEYYEPDAYLAVAQHHTYPATVPDAQPKLAPLNDGCLV